MASLAQFERREDRFDLERAELEQVLSSPSFRKAPKLSRILSYICEKYFDGTAENLKQYSIAVEALERAPGFDPHVDAIVRVDLHLLRKRLQRYYASVGKEHEIQIVLPAGQYVPQFIRRDAQAADFSIDIDGDSSPFAVPNDSFDTQAQENNGAGGEEAALNPGDVVKSNWYRRNLMWLVCAGCLILGLAIGLGSVLLLSNNAKLAIRIVSRKPYPFAAATASFLGGLTYHGAPDMQGDGIRILCGADHDLLDSTGFRWQSDRYFIGGATFYRPNEVIRGFPDQAIFATGRQGIFNYEIPVAPGTYEVHLLFAETEPGVFDGMRPTAFTVGKRETNTIDVVSEAGGINTALMKVYANIRPGEDRKIHINFLLGGGFLNAIEILPQRGSLPNPIRISTLPGIYTDVAGRHWLSDRYFVGGRNMNHDFSFNHPDAPLLSRERYGNFSYEIPVAKEFSYRLNLIMAERYWGPRNSGQGGAGSRIFDVRCNGMNLLHNFDLLSEQKGANAVSVSFQHLHPDANGKLKIDFVPIVNYALVNALEVEPE